MDFERIGDTTDRLGESCVWSVAEQALYWIDVRAPALRRRRLASGETESFRLPGLVGSVALAGGGGAILAMQGEIAHFDPESGVLRSIAAPAEPCPNQRFNDGRCDRQGRFWSGTMDDIGRGEVGTLYRLDADHGLSPVIRPIAIPNALAWSPDGRTMYFSDTVSRTILACDYDPATGAPSAPRVFATVAGPGTPDGSAVDAEGFLWNAEYDNWRVTRYAPDGGVDRVLETPVQRPTCCAFGGPDLSTLYVTTAAQRLSAEELARQPLAGGLLAADIGVRGLPEPVYAGAARFRASTRATPSR